MTDSRPGWAAVTPGSIESNDGTVTISDLVSVTGLSKRTVRDFLRRYEIDSVSRPGENTGRYSSEEVHDAVRNMVGRGHSLGRRR